LRVLYIGPVAIEEKGDEALRNICGSPVERIVKIIGLTK
jgi:hypothetical protein